METTFRTAPCLVAFVEKDGPTFFVLVRRSLGLHDHPAKCALCQRPDALPLGRGVLMPGEHVRDRAQEVDLRGHECDHIRAGFGERCLRMNESRCDDFLSTIRCWEDLLFSARGESTRGCALQKRNVELCVETSGGCGECGKFSVGSNRRDTPT